jgi:hypothetical protein
MLTAAVIAGSRIAERTEFADSELRIVSAARNGSRGRCQPLPIIYSTLCTSTSDTAESLSFSTKVEIQMEDIPVL